MDSMSSNEWRSVTIEQLCKSADLNKRYFYESFADLDAVAAAVVDDIADEVRTSTLAAVTVLAEQSLEQQALVGVTAAVHALVEDPRKARVLLGGVAASPALHTHRRDVMGGLTDVLIGHGRRVHGVELQHDPLAKVTPPFIVGGSADAILAYVNGDVDVTLDELISQLATLWLITGNGAAEVARRRTAPPEG